MEIRSAVIAPLHAAFHPVSLGLDSARADALRSEEPIGSAETTFAPVGAESGARALSEGQGSESLGSEGSGSEDSDSTRAVQDLSEEELQEVQLLQARDSEVRAHEQAHIAAGGAYVTGSASYSFQTGPDGRQYAIGGEVGIDTSMSSDAAANLQKARTLIRAALAPAEPSGQDLSVAASARAMEADAMSDLQQERLEEQNQVAEGRVADAESRIQNGEWGGGDQAKSADEDSSDPDALRKGLEARISALFAGPQGDGLSQFA
ncbi:putative metalloprotease CJM1_0395 family protein [Thiorhodococcus fuscus]|uniref:Metalloprotease CJM1_0395 family protein n=1 Tax=Thiorhodococcus fuscus TaxID=527200 RepID=A0ABW4Y9R5_9GAMM